MNMLSPIITATLQATALASISNILAQFLEAYQNQTAPTFSIAQLLRFQLWTLLSAPPNFQWQAWLERAFPGRRPLPTSNPTHATTAIALQEEGRHASLDDDHDDDDDFESKLSTLDDPAADLEDRKHARIPTTLDVRNTIIKFLLDCMTLGHLFNTLGFLIVMGLLKFSSPAQIVQTVKQETLGIILAGYKIWPIASAISFTVVPVERRIVWLSFVGLLWSIWLSLVAARV